MNFLAEIDPLKESALNEIKRASDLAALEQAKVAYLGTHGKFTALLKQLGSLSKEERPAAGKLINQAKVELESLLNERKSELELKASLPKEPTDFTLPGRVYRRDNADATHNPTFQQIEGLYVDRNVTVGDLKGTVEFIFRDLLGEDVKIRFRPHYFSYTEPSFEIDFSSPLVRKMGKEWLEIAGCGMVHPQVFENVGYDPEVWTGWAFGFGIERIAMIRYGINDIRLFYENDLRFLRQK